MKKWISSGLLFLAFFNISICGREIFAWVAADALENISKTITLDCGQYSPKDALTDVGVQAWLVNSNGTIELDYDHGASEEGVEDVVATNSSLGIRTHLCLYNLINSSWNWGVAKSAFTNNRAKLVQSIMAEVEAYQLDGVNLDLEGPGQSPTADLPAFTELVKDLSAQLKPQGKKVSVATFGSPCFHAPNTSWWREWEGIVNFQHIMGYNETWESNNTTFSQCTADPSQNDKPVLKYSFMVEYGMEIGLHAESVSIGMIVGDRAWGGNNANYHLQTILDLPTVPSVCIWELGYISRSTLWKSSAIWEKLTKIKKIGQTSVEHFAGNTGKKINTLHYHKLINHSVNVPEKYRNSKSFAEVYSLQGQLIKRIQLSSKDKIYIHSPNLHIVKFN